MTPATPAHCCLSADAAPVYDAAGAGALEEPAGAELAVVEAGVEAGVADTVAVGAGEDSAPVADGKVMVIPAEPQYCCANARVAAWSVALQAVLMHDCTELRKLVALQTQAASVAAHPVAPMALRAQVTAHDGRLERSWADARRREERPTAARVKKRIVASFELIGA